MLSSPFTVVSLLSLISRYAVAEESNENQKASTFVFNGTSSEIVFSLNAVDNGDLYFHLSGPAEQSWIALGIGKEMDGALMFVAYADSKGTGVTISPRIADGHSEPSYEPSLKVEQLYEDHLVNANTVNKDGLIVVDAVCRNCSSWEGGKIDFTSTKQPFIFATGPRDKLNSDATDANMQRHDFYGDFTLDMTQATSSGSGQVPIPNGNNKYVLSGATEAEGKTSDSEKGVIVHAVVLCIAFIIIFPVGALVLRVFEKVAWHGWVQAMGLVLVIVGFGSGVYISMEYNKSKSYKSAHQVIGIILFIALMIQLGLGLMHHRMYKRVQRPTWLGKTHLVLGPAIIILGLVNGGLGFDFAGDAHLNIPYVVVIIILAMIFFAFRLVKRFSSRRRGAGKGEEGYQYPQLWPCF